MQTAAIRQSVVERIGVPTAGAVQRRGEPEVFQRPEPRDLEGREMAFQPVELGGGAGSMQQFREHHVG